MKTLKENEMNDQAVLKKRIWLAGAACAAGLAGAGLAWWRLTPQPPADANAEAFWQLSFEQPDGSPLAMQGFKGKPLLLNFWATWCPPCVEELPLLESIWRQNSENKLQILGLAVDQPSSVRRFLAQNQLTFPIGLAGLTGTELGRSLGNTMAALPFSVLFNAQGRVLAQKMGKLEAADLADWLAQLK
jgi:thiol-disulfide isomerase/thioredoxin